VTFPTVTDGAVEVESNGGTVEELQAELATEVQTKEADGRLTVKPTGVRSDPDDAGDADDDASGAAGSSRAGGAPAEAAAPDGAAAAGKGKKRSIQQRIDDLTREKYDTQRAKDAAEREVARLRGELEGLKAGKPAGEPAAKPKAAAAAAGSDKKVGGVALDVEKFPKYGEWLGAGGDGTDNGELEDYLEARDTWRSAKAAHVAERQAVVESHQRHFVGVAHAFNERMGAVLKDEPTFYERVDPRLTETPSASYVRAAIARGELPATTPITVGHFIVDQVVNSEHPKELLLHLSNDKELRRLATLHPDQIVREIAKIEATFSTAAASGKTGPAAGASDDDDDDGDEPPARRASVAEPQSRAAAPAKPVRGSSHSHTSPDEEPGDDASDDEWFRWQKRRQSVAS
jgi:hypothetical protein